MVTKSCTHQIQATVCQRKIKSYQGKGSSNELLFSFAHERKGANPKRKSGRLKTRKEYRGKSCKGLLSPVGSVGTSKRFAL